MEIKMVRLEIDKFINSIQFLNNSAEIQLCRRDLQRSFSSLGLVLKEQGSQTPYKESENHLSPIIEATTAEHDPANSLKSVFDTTDGSQVAKVKAMRHEIQSILDGMRLEVMSGIPFTEHYLALEHFQRSYHQLVEAKCWLGWELGELINKAEVVK